MDLLLGIVDNLRVSCNWGWEGSSDGLYDYSNLKIEKKYTFKPIVDITRLK